MLRNKHITYNSICPEISVAETDISSTQIHLDIFPEIRLDTSILATFIYWEGNSSVGQKMHTGKKNHGITFAFNVVKSKQNPIDPKTTTSSK